MDSRKIINVTGFIGSIEIFDLISEVVIFRGQPIKGNLIPSIARKDKKKNTTSDEIKLLNQLELLGASFLPAGSSKLDLLVLAQHSHLKTRLLDWTSNPLMALWFACADVGDNDAYVYALEADKFLIQNVYSQDPFGQTKTRVFQPRLNNPRILAQHGWFTLHQYSKTSAAFVSLEKNQDIKGHLSEFHIPGDKKVDILRALDQLGISARTIFPDLDGLCNYLNWKYRLEK